MQQLGVKLLAVILQEKLLKNWEKNTLYMYYWQIIYLKKK